MDNEICYSIKVRFITILLFVVGFIFWRFRYFILWLLKNYLDNFILIRLLFEFIYVENYVLYLFDYIKIENIYGV